MAHAPAGSHYYCIDNDWHVSSAKLDGYGCVCVDAIIIKLRALDIWFADILDCARTTWIYALAGKQNEQPYNCSSFYISPFQARVLLIARNRFN